MLTFASVKLATTSACRAGFERLLGLMREMGDGISDAEMCDTAIWLGSIGGDSCVRVRCRDVRISHKCLSVMASQLGTCARAQVSLDSTYFPNIEERSCFRSISTNSCKAAERVALSPRYSNTSPLRAIACAV